MFIVYLPLRTKNHLENRLFLRMTKHKYMIHHPPYFSRQNITDMSHTHIRKYGKYANTANALPGKIKYRKPT